MTKMSNMRFGAHFVFTNWLDQAKVVVGVSTAAAVAIMIILVNSMYYTYFHFVFHGPYAETSVIDIHCTRLAMFFLFISLVATSYSLDLFVCVSFGARVSSNMCVCVLCMFRHFLFRCRHRCCGPLASPLPFTSFSF